MTRVRLETLPIDPTLEYINASYVRGYGGRTGREYICAQAPLSTVSLALAGPIAPLRGCRLLWSFTNSEAGRGGKPKLATMGVSPARRAPQPHPGWVTAQGTYNFVRMIYEKKMVACIMCTGLVERGKRKCARYWPEECGQDACTTPVL